MDLKECLMFCSFCIIIQGRPISSSALPTTVAVSPSEKELQPYVAATTADDLLEDGILKIVSGSLLLLFSGAVALYYLCTGKCCWRRRSEEQERLIPEQLKVERELLEFRGYKEDVNLDPKTAHPRLEVSEDGKCVRDTGRISWVSYNEEQFNSHMFILATESFSRGKHFWEVQVGLKTKWDLGIASASISRQGLITLSPRNGYWVIGLEGRNDYWARTDPWTRLKVNGKPTKIGMFLDMADAKLSFYDVNRKSELFTFTIPCLGTFYPFFSMGSVTTELDSQPLRIG